jgi:hypothetical protein
MLISLYNSSVRLSDIYIYVKSKTGIQLDVSVGYTVGDTVSDSKSICYLTDLMLNLSGTGPEVPCMFELSVLSQCPPSPFNPEITANPSSACGKISEETNPCPQPPPPPPSS